MAREICLDTETTGIDPKSGHRLIEIACVELVDLLPTGRSLHRLVNPEREIEADAERVHGISNAMVADKPKFIEIVDELIAFIDGAPIVAHNAGFDRGFVNMELERIGRKVTQPGDWIDTLQLAQKRFPGMPNSLDALCRRFKISLAEREKHGALIDAQLLAAVYLELCGGKERGLDFAPTGVQAALAAVKSGGYGPRPRPLAARITEAEATAHEAFIGAVLKDKAIWARFVKPAESEPA